MADEPTISALGGEELAVTDAKQHTLLIDVDQDLIDLMHTCPTSWSGDHGFQNWVKQVYDHGAASVPPPEPPPG